MLHQFYQNLLNKAFAGVLCTLAISFNVYSQGIFNNFKTLSDISKESYKTQIKILQNQEFNFQDVKDIQSVSLNIDFINNLLINTPARYFEISKRDKCTYYDLILSNIFQSPEGKIEFIIFDYFNKKSEQQTALAKKSVFIEKVINIQCPGSIKLSKYFDNNNIRKTLQNIKLKQPKNYSDCQSIINSFKDDVKAPYICSLLETLNKKSVNKRRLQSLPKSNYRKRKPIEQEINLASSLEKILKPEALKYIDQICLNIDNTEKFCNAYFSDDYWRREFISKNSEVLKSFCDKSDNKSCLKKFTNKNFCHFPQTKKITDSLKPWPNCEHISLAQSYSRLFQQYNDCPAAVGNNDVVTWGRVLNHFKGLEFKSNKNCKVNSTLPTIKFTEEASDYKSWGAHVCYDDKIKREEVCYPTLLDNSDELSDYSLSTTIGKILKRLKGYNYTNKACRIVSAERYKPTRLEYKNGCIILKEINRCWGTDCSFKVILDEQEFKLFSFKTKTDFEILPTSYLNENKSFKSILEKVEKRTFKRILNISAIRNIMETHSNAILYGVGCAEDILPNFFLRTEINRCTPTPFILDGLISVDGQNSLVTRTSFDHIHAPRIIPWMYIFSGVKSYQKLHPLNTWGLYAIY